VRGIQKKFLDTSPPLFPQYQSQPKGNEMPEEDFAPQKNYFEDVPVADRGSHIKGASSYDWGMKNRLGRIFREATGRTVMLAVDHGYFQGPTTGLERLDLAVPPLLPFADALMATRGAIRTSVPASLTCPIVVRASGGPSVLRELSDERLAMSVDDAVRLNASALAVQLFIGSEHETQSIKNLTTLVDAGMAAGIPVVAVIAVGREMVRDARYFRLATRMAAELGAQVVKCYYTDEGFASVASTCPVPLVVAGGKKLPEREALEMTYRSMDAGALGVDMGRNIFQSDSPIGMIQAVSGIVHGGLSVDDAFTLYEDTRTSLK
jgi:putative autoinducer-2 (AI-2) aldolase|tara:strand:- start:1009 stop:1971 length:963 start_codon:yes stop_codon:yes gene_type:complete